MAVLPLPAIRTRGQPVVFHISVQKDSHDFLRVIPARQVELDEGLEAMVANLPLKFPYPVSDAIRWNAGESPNPGVIAVFGHT